MPRLTKVRMVNIQLDEGKKVIPDLTWKPNGKDTLFMLENGGGKTSFIQSVMQTVLPNSTLAGRKMKNTLAKGSTGHVATEWRLDGDSPKYLCTGFTFLNGKTSSEQLKYFTYAFSYNRDKENEMTIDTLPMIHRQNIATYSEFRKTLQKTQEPRVQVFDTIEPYHQTLTQYQMVPQEWEYMQKINSDEGGVSAFFEKAKTEHELLTKLLIPTVEDSIFQSKKEKEQLLESFKGFQENLFKIPEIRKDLSDFLVMQTHAEDVIKAVQAYDGEEKAFKQSKEELQQLYVSFSLYQQELEREEQQSLIRQKELKTQQEELRWKKESYLIHEAHHKWQEAQKKEEDVAHVLQKEETLLDTLRQMKKETEALFYYGKYEEEKKDEHMYKVQLETAKMSNEEKFKTFEEVKEQFQDAWNVIKRTKQDHVQEVDEALQDVERKQQEAQDSLKELRAKKENLVETIVSLQNHMTRYEEEKERIQQIIGFTESQDLPNFLLRQQEQIISLEQLMQSDQTEEKEAEDSLDTHTTQLQQAKMDQRDLEHTRTQLRKEEDAYQQAKQHTMGLVAGNGKIVSDVWKEKDEVLHFLQRKVNEYTSQKEKVAVTVEKLRQRVDELKEQDYFVPHQQLLELKQLLLKTGVYVVLGSEWLSQQAMSESEKEQYINQHPLLPYSLLVEEQQISALTRAIEKAKGKHWEIPVLFQIKEQLSTSSSSQDTFVKTAEGTLIYPSLEAKLFASKDEMKRILAATEQALADEKTTLQKSKEQEQFYTSIYQDVSRFYQTYEKMKDEDFTRKWEESNQAWTTLLRDIETCTEQIQHQKTLIRLCRDNYQLHQKEWQEATDVYKQVESFQESFATISEEKLSLTEAVHQRDEWVTAILEMETAIRHMNEDHHLLRDQYRDSQREVEEHNKVGKKHGFVEKHNSSLSIDEDTYQQLSLRYDELNLQMQREAGEVKSIEELLKKTKAIIAERLDQFDTLGISLEWLSQHKRWVSSNEIKEAEQANQTQQRLVEKAKEDLTACRIETGSCQSNLKLLKERLYTAFELEPYVFSEEAKEEYLFVLNEIKNNEQAYSRVMASLDETKTKQQQVTQALEAFSDISYVSLHTDDVHPLPMAVWQEKSRNATTAQRKYKNKADKDKEKMEETKEQVKKAFERYLTILDETNNPKIRDFSLQFSRAMDSANMFNYDFVVDRFTRILDGIESLEQAHHTMLLASERDKGNLINLMYQRILTVYENIKEIPRHSRVSLYGKTMDLIQMNWKREEEETTLQQLNHHLERLLHEIKTMMDEGTPEDDIQLFIESKMQTIELLNLLAPINSCVIKIFKPRKETLVETGMSYMHWREAADWSGGEKYAAYMTMFMVLLTHIRKKTFAKEKAWKFIIADNPFGKASSDHVVKPIIELANKSKIQLFCLTAIKEEGIRKHFQVVSSNRYYHVGGKELMRTQEQHVEIGQLFYEQPELV